MLSLLYWIMLELSRMERKQSIDRGRNVGPIGFDALIDAIKEVLVPNVTSFKCPHLFLFN